MAQGKIANEGKGTQPFFIVEGDTPISERYEFDESAIGRNLSLTDNSATANLNNKYTVIENIVAITKKLHNHTLPLASGKWVFGQIRLDSPLPSVASKLHLVINASVANRFTRSTITLDDEVSGEIRFIVSA